MQTLDNFDPAVGAKFDGGKLMWDLMPWDALGDVQKVIDYGAEKYAPHNWKLVKAWRPRYFSAVVRHLTAWHNGEMTDPESGLPHLAHAMCSLLFMRYLEVERHG